MFKEREKQRCSRLMQNGDNHIHNCHFGRCIVRYVRKSCLMAPLACRLADGVPPSNENFEHINPVNVTVSQHVPFQFLFLVYDPNTTKSGSPSLFKWRFVAGVPMMAQY